MVRLSSEYGILTECTAFLALEGTDLSKRGAVLTTAGQNFFYHRSGRWVDGRLVQRTDPPAGARVAEFGSAEYDRLAGRMAAEHRAGVMALRGEILTEVDDRAVLFKGR